MEISQWEEWDFSLAIDLYTNKTLHRHWRIVTSLGSYHIPVRKSFEPLWSKLS